MHAKISCPTETELIKRDNDNNNDNNSLQTIFLAFKKSDICFFVVCKKGSRKMK